MEPSEIKDITSTFFGLLVGYIAPGLASLHAISLRSSRVSEFFNSAKHAEGFFLILLASLVIGTLLNGLHLVGLHQACNKKWKLLWTWELGWKVEENNFRKLQNAEKLACYLAVVSEYYRAHQFFGTMVLVIPMYYLGWDENKSWFCHAWYYHLGFFLLWVFTIIACFVSWKYHVEIGSNVLSGEPPAVAHGN